VGARLSASRRDHRLQHFHVGAEFIVASRVEFRGCFHFGGTSMFKQTRQILGDAAFPTLRKPRIGAMGNTPAQSRSSRSFSNGRLQPYWQLALFGIHVVATPLPTLSAWGAWA